jgi:hypothetical protein
VTYLLDAREMALGEQVTPTEYRSFHRPRAIERSLLRSGVVTPYGVTWSLLRSDGITGHRGAIERSLLRSDGIIGHRGAIERSLLRSDGITGHRGAIERSLLRSDGITGHRGAIERTLLTE